MREDVCIVLNEREPLKQQMANELVEQLELRQLACSKIESTEHPARIIIERNPRVLVIDYVIGDITTALDVLAELKTHQQENQTKVILWTDEPSVYVAVTSMKLGAKDFIELDTKSSLERVLKSIDNCLESDEETSSKTTPKKRHKSFENPISQSKNFEHSLGLATSLAVRNAPVTILQGPTGCGQRTVANFLHKKRKHAGRFVELNMESWPGDIAEICGGEGADSRYVPYLSQSATVFISHIEFDTGELLETICNQKNEIWGTCETSETPALVVGSNSSDTTAMWRKLLDAEVIEIPSLSERPDDFWPLVQHFIASTKGSFPNNKLKFSAAVVQELTQLPWPGNVKQLRACILEAISLPDELVKTLVDEKQNELKGDKLVVSLVTAAKTRWEQYHFGEMFVPEPLLARKALDDSLGNYRIAAVQLGTGIPQLKKALSLSTTTNH